MSKLVICSKIYEQCNKKTWRIRIRANSPAKWFFDKNKKAQIITNQSIRAKRYIITDLYLTPIDIFTTGRV